MLYTIKRLLEKKKGRFDLDADFNLIEQMQQGEEEAFNCFIKKYYADILRYCIYHCNDKEDAKDLTQDTFLKFFSGFSNYVHRGKAKNYLYTIARNNCKNYYRKKRIVLIDYEESNFLVNNSEHDLIEGMMVRECLDNLSEEFREVVILYYYQGLKQKEIATILGIKLPLVKYRLRKAKQYIKNSFESEVKNECRKNDNER